MFSKNINHKSFYYSPHLPRTIKSQLCNFISQIKATNSHVTVNLNCPLHFCIQIKYYTHTQLPYIISHSKYFPKFQQKFLQIRNALYIFCCCALFIAFAAIIVITRSRNTRRDRKPPCIYPLYIRASIYFYGPPDA